jgi:hypothetical protein
MRNIWPLTIVSTAEVYKLYGSTTAVILLREGHHLQGADLVALATSTRPFPCLVNAYARKKPITPKTNGILKKLDAISCTNRK